MNDYEDDAVYNLGETCIDSLTVGELLELAGGRRRQQVHRFCIQIAHSFYLSSGDGGFFSRINNEKKYGEERFTNCIYGHS